MSLTDEIYQELTDGLKAEDFDWTAFIAKHGASKGPLYNAIGRFFTDIELTVRELNEVRTQLDEAGLKLESLDKKIEEAEGSLAPLEKKRSSLNTQIEALERKIEGKNKLLEHAKDLEQLGLDIQRLGQLRETLAEIATKHGLKGNEATSKFFSDLKDYDTKTGFEQEIQRLETITDTRRLQAEKWQAEADKIERQYKELEAVTDAVRALLNQGVKTEQIMSWSAIVSRLGGPQVLHESLEQYQSMSELLATRKSEIEDCEKKVAQLTAQVKTLSTQKAEIEGAIESLSRSGVDEISKIGDKARSDLSSLSSSGVQEISRLSGKAMTELKSVSTSGLQEVTKVGDKAIAELRSLLAETRVETKKLADLKAEVGRLEKELMYARYITTADQTVLKAFPKEVVFAFLDRTAVYCKLNELNQETKMPDNLYDKYYPTHFISTPAVSLLDLIIWLQVGLAGTNQ